MRSMDKVFNTNMKNRFRGFLPVVIDIETAGVQPEKNALLEICAVLLEMDDKGHLFMAERHFEHVLPFENAVLDAESLAFNQIDPFQPLRFAVDEKIALERLFAPIYRSLKKSGCERAVLVGHNAWFDLLFLKAAIQRCGIKSPFHAFTCFDTATLGGFIYGQTVLAKVSRSAGMYFDANEAHSAIYDAEKTAELFCIMANSWRDLQFHEDKD